MQTPDPARRIVVLGAGLIGSSLVHHLSPLQPARSLAIVSRTVPDDLGRFLGAQDAVLGEIGKGVLEGRLRDGDIVFAAHGVATPRTPLREARQVVLPVLEAASELLEELADRSDVDLVVFSSGGSVYGASAEPLHESSDLSPNSAYGATKVAEEYVLDQLHGVNGNRVTRLRVATLYGSRGARFRSQGLVQRVVDLMSQGQPVPVFGTGTSRRDYVHVDDLADLALRVAVRSGAPDGDSVLNVGSGEVHSINEVVATVAGCLDIKEPAVTFVDGAEFDVVLDVERVRQRFPDWQPRSLTSGVHALLRS